MTEPDKETFIDYFEIIFRWRGFIVRNILVLTAVAIIVSFIIPSQYTSVTTILPSDMDQPSMMGMMSTMMQSNLSRLSSLGGSLQGYTFQSELFAAILKSGRIRSKIVSKYDLKKYFQTKTMADAHEALDNVTRITISPEGIISIAITLRNKVLAANIANSFVEELDRYNNETAITMGKKYRIFIEQRLKSTRDSLSLTEETLRDFQKKYKTITLEEEIKGAIQNVAELRSQIIVLEAKRNALATVSELNNPMLQNTDRELAALKQQLANIEFGDKGHTGYGAGFSMAFSQLPELSLAYARLVRDVKVQEAIYEVLVQQYEQSKIMEAKDTPTIQVIDPAGPAEKRSTPQRRKIIMIVFFASIVFNIGLAIFVDRYQKAKQHQDRNLQRWSAIAGGLKKDIVSFFKSKKKL